MPHRFSTLTPASVGLILIASIGGYTGCKKDEPPPPMPSAAPAPTPTPTEALQLVPETPIADAGVEDAAVKKTGTASAGHALANCCAALNSNADLAPEPNKSYLKAAAQACSIAVGAGASNAAVLAAVTGALRGAGVPATCK